MPNWLLRLIQMAIVIAVSGSAAYWQWTKNGYLMGILGIAAAYAFTKVYGWLLDRLASPADRAAAAALAREEEEAYRVIDDPSSMFGTSDLTKDPGPLWIGNQTGDLIDVTPKAPALDNLSSLPGQLEAPTSSKGSGRPKR